MIEVQHLPVVDVHAHPFLDKGAVTLEQFTNLISFGGGSQEYMEEGGVAFDENVRAELLSYKQNTVYFKRMMLDLAGFFGIEPDPDAAIAARNEAVAGGYI